MNEELDQLKREVARTRSLLNVLLTVAVLLLLLPNLAIPVMIPRFEKIFADMLGSLEKLPTLTQSVLAYGRALSGIGIAPLLVLPALAVCVGLFAAPRSRRAISAAVLAIIFLGLHFAMIVFSLYVPLLLIIEIIGGKLR